MEDTDQQDQFQYWLAHMDEALEAFLDALSAAWKGKLDGSAESLIPLEQMLLEKYRSLDEARPSSEKAFLDGAARYYGEILRQGTRSKWELQLDDKDSVFYGIPVLNGGRIEAVPICPLTNITAAISRRTGNLLRNANARLAEQRNLASRPLLSSRLPILKGGGAGERFNLVAPLSSVNRGLPGNGEVVGKVDSSW